MKRQKFMSRDCYTDSRESIFAHTHTHGHPAAFCKKTKTRQRREKNRGGACFRDVRVLVETEVTISDLGACEQARFFLSKCAQLACVLKIRVYITAIGTLYSNVYSFGYLRASGTPRVYITAHLLYARARTYNLRSACPRKSGSYQFTRKADGEFCGVIHLQFFLRDQNPA